MGFSLFFLVFKRFSFHLLFLSLQLQNVLITVLSTSYKREETPSISVGMNLNSCFHLLRAQFFSILIKPNTSVIRVIRRKQDWKKESLHFFFPVSYIITPFTSPMGSTFLLPYFFFTFRIFLMGSSSCRKQRRSSNNNNSKKHSFGNHSSSSTRQLALSKSQDAIHS